MAIPLFTGPAGSLPSIRPEDFSSAPELILRARESGARIAGQYEDIENSRQQRDLNSLRMEQARLDLEQERQLGPLQLEAERLKLQQQSSPEFQELQKNKIAQELRVTKQSNDFAAIFQGSDPQAKVNAVTSGQFAELFSTQPKLQEEAVRTTMPLMTPEQRRAYQQSLGNEWLAKRAYARQEKASDEYGKLLDEFTDDMDLMTLWQDRYAGEADVRSLPDKWAVIPSNEIARGEDGKISTDANGSVIRQEPIPGDPREDTFAILERGTNKYLGPATKEQADVIRKLQIQKSVAGRTGLTLEDLPPADVGVEQYKQQAEIAQRQRAAQVPTSTPAAAQEESGPSLSQRIFSGIGSPVTNAIREVLTPGQFDRLRGQAAANTPDTNQVPQDKLKQKVLSGIQNNPQAQITFQQKTEKYNKRAADLVAGKKDITFAPIVEETRAMFTNVDYQPRDISPIVIGRVNNDPLLADKSPIIKGLAATESGGRWDVESPTGVKGIMQMTKATARGFGLNRDVPAEQVKAAELLIDENLAALNREVDKDYAGAERELYQNLKLTRTPILAIAAYNRGVGTILDAVRATGSYDWDVVRDHLQKVLPEKEFKEVRVFPETVLNYAAAFAGTEV